ncbi:hypothetical protein [Streptomyces colonosanans]|uniref:hypothetical protein n=1 Tax=Streptomyces colonosanans TaxID=1428652 RepID=UPI0015A572AE|nr:hypothetical protein [Streptomyces colonosanans]
MPRDIDDQVRRPDRERRPGEITGEEIRDPEARDPDRRSTSDDEDEQEGYR